MDRCGNCPNCQKFDKIRNQLRKAIVQAGNSLRAVDDGCVLIYNDAIKRYPCTQVKEKSNGCSS